MIRVERQRLDASSNKGYLYQFCPNWDDLESIVSSGEIWLSGYSELSWETDKSIERDKNGMSRFASLTRNPSNIIYAKAGGKWRFAVVLDSERLTDKYKIKPYSFFFRPGIREYVLEDWGNYYLLAKDGAISTDGVKLTKAEGDQVVKWVKEMAPKGYVKLDVEENQDVTSLEDMPTWVYDSLDEEEIEDLFGNKNEPKATYYFKVNLGNEKVFDRRVTSKEAGGKNVVDGLKYLPQNALPKVLYRAASKVYTESEERIYPNKKDKTRIKDEDTGEVEEIQNDINIKKALVGVLIPDSQYFTQDRLDFEQKFPNLKIWIYRDPRLKDNWIGTYKLKEYLDINPEVKELYKLPR